MLSFLTDLENTFSELRHKWWPMRQKTDQGAADSEDAEYPIEASNTNKVHRATVLLMILFGMGLGALFLMIKKSSPQMASAQTIGAEHARIDTTIAQLSQASLEMSEGMRKLIGKFNQADSVRQVGIGQLVKNPFRTEKYLGDLSHLSGIDEFDWGSGLDLGQLKQKAKSMQLLSIMRTGKRMCCMINDKILYEGDSIEGFEVGYIGSKVVKLKSNGMEVVLRLAID